MPSSKSRRKRYTPKQIKVPSIIERLPLPGAFVDKFKAQMTTTLLRMRMSRPNGKDLASLAFSFGHAWILASLMDEPQSLRYPIETTINDLGKAVIKDPERIDDALFDRLADLIDLTAAVVAKSTKSEFIKAGDLLKKEDSVEFVEDFLTILAQAGMLEMLPSSEAEQ